MRRRELLQLGSAAAIGTLLPAAAIRETVLVYDSRYAAARTLATASRSPVHALPADPMTVWHAGLGAAQRIVGLTSYADMHIFADLARQAGRRMTTRIAHHIGKAGTSHVRESGTTIIGPLVKAGALWPIALWALLGGAGQAALEHDDRRGTLWSWVIEV